MNYQKPIPVAGEYYKFSNKKMANPRSGMLCRVLVAAEPVAGVHNCLIEFEDGYKMITSKWNIFNLQQNHKTIQFSGKILVNNELEGEQLSIF